MENWRKREDTGPRWRRGPAYYPIQLEVGDGSCESSDSDDNVFWIIGWRNRWHTSSGWKNRRQSTLKCMQLLYLHMPILK